MKFRCATVVASALTAAIIGLAAPAQAAHRRGKRAADDQRTAGMGIHRHRQPARFHPAGSGDGGRRPTRPDLLPDGLRRSRAQDDIPTTITNKTVYVDGK